MPSVYGAGLQMPFGKYKGWRLESIPGDYLEWVLENLEKINPRLRAAIDGELDRRAGGYHEPDPEEEYQDDGDNRHSVLDLRGIVQRWFGELSRKFHPDRGGSHERMVALNEAHECLKKMLDL